MVKELVTYTIGNLYKLKWAGGGELPKALTGSYTSEAAALKAGDAYIASRPKKVTKNAKDNSRA